MLHHIFRAFALLIAMTCLAAFATVAPAAETILYVSTAGSNSNPCTLAQPCRSLQYAINRTPANGELRVLDSGFYGNNATVNRTMTVSGNGHTLTLGSAINVNSAGATVTLRRLVLNGEGSTSRGIEILAATAVHIEHCVVHGFTANGIRLNGVNSEVFVTDSIVRDNGTEGLNATGAGSAKLTVDNSRFERNGNVGLYTETIESTISRTVSSGNGGNGVHAAQNVRMNVTSSTSADNFHGYVVTNGGDIVLESSVARGNSNIGAYAFNGTVTISNSVFTHNGTGVHKLAAGTVLTRQNNVITNNGTNVIGALTPLTGL
jgi:Right handed beta helix region